MYNRYVPAEDGTFRRQSLPESPRMPDVPRAPQPPATPPCPTRKAETAESFFAHLLPGGLDTEDLIVVLLLLLMSENCTDTPNTALITMLVYLFL